MTILGRGYETETITAEAYFADPKAAADLAEKVGRLVVKDTDGRIMLIINSHRSTSPAVIVGN